jgi:hypothetical protein
MAKAVQEALERSLPPYTYIHGVRMALLHRNRPISNCPLPARILSSHCLDIGTFSAFGVPLLHHPSIHFLSAYQGSQQTQKCPCYCTLSIDQRMDDLDVLAQRLYLGF